MPTRTQRERERATAAYQRDQFGCLGFRIVDPIVRHKPSLNVRRDSTRAHVRRVLRFIPHVARIGRYSYLRIKDWLDEA